MDSRFDKALVMNNVRYVFLLNALWNCMRKESIEEFREAGRMDLLHDKIKYLLELRKTLLLGD
jgi:hypothetical protein